jgi:hypothetical protein
MYFYRMVRTSSDHRLEEYLYSQDRCFIIPIVDPNSPSGKALLSDEYSLLLSDASEKINTDIVYIGKEVDAYKHFISDLIKWANVIGEMDNMKDPSIIIKTAKEWELFIINNIKEDDPGDIKRILWGLINCMNEPNLGRKIKHYISKRKLKLFYTNNTESINSFLQIVQIVTTFATPVPKLPAG